MAKFLKICLYTLLTLIILSAISIIIVANFVNPNHFKQPLQSQLTELTGRDTVIDGDISWRFFPWLGFSVKDISIDNMPGFQADYFAEINDLQLSVKLLPLISGDVEIGTITIDQLHLNLEIDQQGNNNWNALIAADEAASVTNSPATTNNDDEENYFDLKTLHIANIAFTNGVLTLNNQQEQQILTISDINLHSKNIVLQQAFPVKLSFAMDYRQQNTAIITGDIQFNGDVTIDNQIWQSDAALLPAITLNGTFTAKPLQIDKLHIDQLRSDISIDNQVVKLSPITSQLYGGKAHAHVTADFSQNQPRFTLQQSLQNLQAGPMFSDLIGIDRITGTAELDLDLQTRGKTSSTLFQNLDGHASFSFYNGAIEGLDISYLINWAAAVFQREPVPPSQNNATPFGDLTGTAVIKQGVIRNDDLMFKSSAYHIAGEGLVDLNKQYIDYRLDAQLINLSDNNPLEKIQQAVGGSIPIIVRGHFGVLYAEPDVDIMIKQGATNIVDQQLQRVLDDPEKASKKAKKLLENIFDE